MFSLSFRDELEGHSAALVEELDQIAAAAQAKWYPQHDASGQHRNFHATGPLVLQDATGAPYCLYVEGGTLYIATGTTASGGTVVGTQT